MAHRVVYRASMLILGTVMLCAAAEGQTPQALQPAERLHLAPRYRSGQTLRYQIDFRTQTSNHSAGAVENPQGATQIDLAVTLLLRLKVLSTLPAFAPDSADVPRADAASASGRTRLRATYEKAAVVVGGDTFDPAAGDIEAQYRKLEGLSVEFTLNGDGTIENVTGLEEVLKDEKAKAAAREWLRQMSAGAGFPREGARLGETWSAQKRVEEAALKDTVLETHSTYERNEKCSASAEAQAETNAADASPSPEAEEMCAVVVTHSEMKQQGKSGRSGEDATPDAFRKRGLQSSGTLVSAGESLTYISLATGFTISVTQSGTQEMNMTVRHTKGGGAPLHYETKASSETHLTLLPRAAAPAPPANP